MKMRYIITIFTLLLLIGCSTDNHIDINDSVYFIENDLKEITLPIMGEEDFEYPLLIHEGGYYQDEFLGSLFTDFDYLVRYNALHGTDYEMLDKQYYSFEEDFKIDTDTSGVSVPLIVYTDLLFNEEGVGTYYIPIGIKSKTFKGEVTSDISNFLLALTLEKPKVEMENNGEYTLGASQDDIFNTDISVKLNVKSTTDLEIQYQIDDELINEGEELLDSAYYSVKNKVVIPEGERMGANNLELDVDKIPGGVWVIPIRASAEDDKIEVREDAYIKVLIRKGSLENLKWSQDYLLDAKDGKKLVFGPGETPDIEVGNFEDDGTIVEASSSENWAKVEISNGKVKLNLDEYNASPGDTRSATIALSYPNGSFSENIEILQLGSSAITSKGNWGIQPGNNSTTATGGEPFSNIIDGDINTHWQWDWPNGDDSDFPSTPYEFIIDLGSPQVFNTIKLWQTQSATNGYVKDVQFEVSNDKSNWKDLGEYRMSDSSDDAIAKGDDPYVYQLPGVYQTRYVKLIILSNVGDENVNSKKNAYMGEMDISFE